MTTIKPFLTTQHTQLKLQGETILKINESFPTCTNYMLIPGDNATTLKLQITQPRQRFNINFVIHLKQHQNLTIKIIAIPLVNHFNFRVFIKAVLEDSSTLEITTDALPPSNVTKGYAEFQERFLIYDNAQLISTPEFSILPAGIEQIHGMVVYTLDPKEQFYLQSRGFAPRQGKHLLSTV